MYMYMYIIYCNIIVTLGSCHIAKLHLNHVSHLSMKHRPAAEPTLQYPEMCVCVYVPIGLCSPHHFATFSDMS